MKKKSKISIIYGSTRKKRIGIRFVKYLKNQIQKSGHTPIVIDPKEMTFPFLDKRFDDYKKNLLPKSISRVQKLLKSSHAFILVSAEYNHMPPPALINLLNFYYKEYDRKASCVCTYSSGDFAGIRVQSPLRAFLTQFGCPPIKHGMYQPNLANFFSVSGKPKDEIDAKSRFDNFFNELIWYTEAYDDKKLS